MRRLISNIIIFFHLIQEGQLSVSGARICTDTGQLLRGLSLPRKKVLLGKLTVLDMTLI